MAPILPLWLVDLVLALGEEVVRQIVIDGATGTPHAETVRDILPAVLPTDRALDAIDRDLHAISDTDPPPSGSGSDT